MPTKKKTEEITDSIMEAQNETEEQNTARLLPKNKSKSPREPAKRNRKLPKPRSSPLMRRSSLKRKNLPMKKLRQNP